MKFLQRGRFGGLLGSVLGIYLMISANSIPASRVSGDPGSGMLPKMAGMICFVSGLILLIKKPDETDRKQFLSKQQWIKVFSLLGMYLAFFVGMYIFGYIVTAPIVIFATCSIMARGKNVSVIKRIFFSLAVAAFIYVLFHMILNVILPVGLLGIG